MSWKVLSNKLLFFIFLIFSSALQALVELNLQVAIFRDLLLGVGSTRDSPELRERIRKVRMDAMQEVIKTNNSLLPHIKK